MATKEEEFGAWEDASASITHDASHTLRPEMIDTIWGQQTFVGKDLLVKFDDTFWNLKCIFVDEEALALVGTDKELVLYSSHEEFAADVANENIRLVPI